MVPKTSMGFFNNRRIARCSHNTQQYDNSPSPLPRKSQLSLLSRKSAIALFNTNIIDILLILLSISILILLILISILILILLVLIRNSSDGMWCAIVSATRHLTYRKRSGYILYCNSLAVYCCVRRGSKFEL